MTDHDAGPSVPASNLPEPVRELLTAISELLTLPNPAGERLDLVRYECTVSERIHLVQLAIQDALDGKHRLAWEADYLRRQIEARPPRYRTAEQETADLHRILRGSEGR